MIKENIERLKKEIPSNVKIIAISKTQPIEKIIEAYNCGIVDFGENRVQELLPKHKSLNIPIKWHMVGHLQTNKVKYIANFIHLIHSVDSLKLLKEIDKRAKNSDVIVDCLLQIHIAQEETKFGLNEIELFSLLQNKEFYQLRNIRILGLMGMATFTDNYDQINKEFKYIRSLYEKIKKDYANYLPYFNELSIGMSNDYKIAIDNGSTMVRIGTLIFGERLKK